MPTSPPMKGKEAKTLLIAIRLKKSYKKLLRETEQPMSRNMLRGKCKNKKSRIKIDLNNLIIEYLYMSQQQSSAKKNKTANQSMSNALPSDIHSGAMSPAPSNHSSKFMQKAQSISMLSNKFSNTSKVDNRKIQTVGRDLNSKMMSGQRSVSRGANIRDFRQLRTDRR